MEDVITIKVNGDEKIYAESIDSNVNLIDYNTLRIDLNKFKRIVFETEYDNIEFEPQEIISLLSSLVELNKRFYNIMELAERKDEIFKRLDAAKYGMPYFGGV